MTLDQVRTALHQRFARETGRDDERRATLRRMDGVRTLLGRTPARSRSAATGALRTGAGAARVRTR
jgi:hypothetical protein